ncbi:MAG: prepilin-type N-terminal cleavage/methylation domain-containing protein [Puniceicoccaceae bacterium]|nr:MAG: prepilin-type N-terminal cleavage/methylation domain-containing protein [Puniceicoccaceae bacterium]|tara:strand:+ start:483 stop:1133 length:651 start_codon:yes stop_codon:yes gene_type:complete
MNSSSKNSAFTLIELLVVISIILIASSIIFIGGGGGEGAKLSSSQRIISGIAQGARGQAILKNATTRLIIYSDLASNEDEEKKLRYFGIVYEDNANPGQWFAATQGTYLPEGIYFNKDLSKEYPTSSTMKINYPRQSAQSGSSGEEYYYYEFNSNGTMATNYDNTWLAIQAGTLKPNSGGVLGVDFTEIENEGLKAALIFRRVGTTTFVSDPTDIY